MVDTFPEFAQNQFEKRQVLAYWFSKEFRAHREMYRPIGKEHFAVFKSLQQIQQLLVFSSVFISPIWKARNI
jgi:hypothetical protein